MSAQDRSASDLAWSTTDKIVVRGKDLPNEILGHLNLGDMAFLEIGRTSPQRERIEDSSTPWR